MTKQVSLIPGRKPRCDAVRETRYARDAHDMNQCTRVARYKIGRLTYCEVHARREALEILLEAGRTP